MIRLLTLDDLPWVVVQEQEVFGHSLGLEHYSTLFHLGDLFGYLSNTGVQQGALICSKNGEHVQIENLFVVEAYRQQGIATSLLQQLMNDMADLSGRYISLEVRVDLTHVISLYQSLGFETVKRISNYYPDHTDAYYMVYERSDA